MSRFDTVTRYIGQLDPLVSQALKDDLIENALVLARRATISGPLLPGTAAFVMADMFAAYYAVQGEVTRVKGRHKWLSRSSRSEELLVQAQGLWERIGMHQSAIIQEIADGRGHLSNGEWSGVASGEHLATVAERQAKEAEFARSLGRLVEGCSQSRALTQMVMGRAMLMTGATITQAMGARQQPSALSTKPRNWRLRALAGIFHALDVQLAKLEAKIDWGHSEEKVASIFREHADTLKQLKNMGGGGALMYTMT